MENKDVINYKIINVTFFVFIIYVNYITHFYTFISFITLLIIIALIFFAVNLILKCVVYLL